MKKEISIYTDGSYDDIRLVSGWGFVVIKDNKVVYEEAGKIENPLSRQIDGELYAVRKALSWIKNNGVPATINVDYIGAKEWWYGKWKASKSVSKEYVIFCDNIRDDIDVEFKHVKSHIGIYWNEYVDGLAKKGETNEISSS